MLRKVILENIQSNIKTILRLHSGFNVIIGPTDSGKTGIKRGIELVAFNRPLNPTQVLLSHGADTGRTKLVYDDCSVERSIGKINHYKLNDRILKASNKKVPDEVKQAINMNEINFQDHTDPYFLLTKSDPEVARYLNKIVDLDIIDESIKNSNKERNKFERKLKEVDNRIEKLSKKIKKLKWIDLAEGKIEILKQEKQEINKLSKKIDKIESLMNTLNELNIKLIEIRSISKFKDKIEDMHNQYNELKSEENKIKSIENKLVMYEGKKKRKKFLKNEIRNIKKILNKIMPNICPLCEQEIKNAN